MVLEKRVLGGYIDPRGGSKRILEKIG